MKLYGAAFLAIAALLLPVTGLVAQSQGDGSADGAGSPSEAPSIPSAAEDPVNPFLTGEQLIGLSAGFHIPAFLAPVTGGGIGNSILGGSFSFSYQYFVARGFSVGGNIAGAFNGTIGGNSIFTAPLGATVSYWWTKLPFEFSVLEETGAFLVRYNGTGMIGPFFKGGGGAYWRATPSWSLGLQAYLWFLPEIHYGKYSSLSQYGGFVETSLAAVYHL
jgi:hypothetical protein